VALRSAVFCMRLAKKMNRPQVTETAIAAGLKQQGSETRLLGESRWEPGGGPGPFPRTRGLHVQARSLKLADADKDANSEPWAECWRPRKHCSNEYDKHNRASSIKRRSAWLLNALFPAPNLDHLPAARRRRRDRKANDSHSSRSLSCVAADSTAAAPARLPSIVPAAFLALLPYRPASFGGDHKWNSGISRPPRQARPRSNVYWQEWQIEGIGDIMYTDWPYHADTWPGGYFSSASPLSPYPRSPAMQLKLSQHPGHILAPIDVGRGLRPATRIEQYAGGSVRAEKIVRIPPSLTTRIAP